MPIHHKRGYDFVRAGQFAVAGGGLNITDMSGWIGRCQVRTQSGLLVSELAFTWLDAAQRLFELSAPSAETSGWPVGTHRFDIQLTTPAGQKVPGPTDLLILSVDETR